MLEIKSWVRLLSCAGLLAACSDDGDDTKGTASGAAEGSAGEVASAGAGGKANAAGAGGKANAAGQGAAGASAATKVDLAAFEATGLTKYRGKAKPARTESEGDETHYFFDEADGPVCLRGGQYAMATRDRGSQDLVIFLQGGGSCNSNLCRATETANPKIPARAVLDANLDVNPVKDWNVVYAPYCDGSLHFGDSDIPDQNRKHHGLRNTSAALDVAVEKFPKPRRVLLTGASAGGYGTIWITALVRLAYPDAELFVLNDAGIAVANPANANGFRSVLGEWGATQFIPEGCEECKTSPHLTSWMSWNLQHDPTLKLGMFSAYEDSVIAGTFLMIDSKVFKQTLLDETAKVVEVAPDRAKRFLIEGTQHTIGDLSRTAVGDETVAKWLGKMLEGEGWDNVLQ